MLHHLHNLKQLSMLQLSMLTIIYATVSFKFIANAAPFTQLKTIIYATVRLSL